MWPQTVPELLIMLLFVVPGFIYQGVRISVRGRLPGDVDLSTRIVRAIVASVIFGLVYLLAFGNSLITGAQSGGYLVQHPRVGALLGLGLGIAAPALVALARTPQWHWLVSLTERLPQVTHYDATPTAWDRAFQRTEECFVRVLTKDGRWIAGFYGPESYATSYPEERQLFLERAYYVSKKGVIGEEIENSRGVMVMATDVSLVQIVAPEYGAEEES